VEEIDDEDDLYRRLILTSVNRRGDVTRGAYYRAGMEPDPEISVNIARLSSPDATVVGGPPGCDVGVIKAGAARAIGLEVRHDPLADNPAHALILGATTRDDCSRLAEATRVLLPPMFPAG
jgi:hypothetical protein